MEFIFNSLSSLQAFFPGNNRVDLYLYIVLVEYFYFDGFTAFRDRFFVVLHSHFAYTHHLKPFFHML